VYVNLMEPKHICI